MTSAARRGLTVLELVIILVLLGVLIAILLPRFRGGDVPASGAAASAVRVDQGPDSVVAPGATARVTVTLADSAGRPASAARVTFSVTRGGGSVNPPAALTDSSGRASTEWAVGADTGQKVLTATAADRPGTAVLISTTARPPIP
jgi:hypothetical protein